MITSWCGAVGDYQDGTTGTAGNDTAKEWQDDTDYCFGPRKASEDLSVMLFVMRMREWKHSQFWALNCDYREPIHPHVIPYHGLWSGIRPQRH